MLPLETELSTLFPESNDREIVAAYYGIDGKNVRSYQTISEQKGVTRSRIHQIVRDYERKHPLKSAETPTLDTVIDVVNALTPGSKSAIESTLQARGLTQGLFKLECILKIAKLLNRNLHFQITHINGIAIAHSAALSRWRGIQQARAYVRYWGAARIEDISRWISSDLSRELDMARLTIAGQKDFRWLNESSGWFWFADVGRNRVVSRIRKILSVTPEIDTSVLRCGLAKTALTRLPDDCLLELCRQIPGVTVFGGSIRATTAIAPRSILNRTEQVIRELISRNGGPISVARLEAQSSASGVARATLFQCLTYSPIVIRVNVGYYALLNRDTAARGMVEWRTSDPVPSGIRSASMGARQGNNSCGV